MKRSLAPSRRPIKRQKVTPVEKEIDNNSNHENVEMATRRFTRGGANRIGNEKENLQQLYDLPPPKNYPMIPSDDPIYMLCYYKQSSAKQGNGLLIVSYYDAIVISMDNKHIAKFHLVRTNGKKKKTKASKKEDEIVYDDESDNENDNDNENENEDENEEEVDNSSETVKKVTEKRPKHQTIVIKGRMKHEVYICEGQTISLGNKEVQIGPRVDEEEVTSGTFFMRDYSEGNMVEKELKNLVAEKKKKEAGSKLRLAGARRPKQGQFRIPWKGDKREKKKLTQPLHSPHIPNAVVLYNPRGASAITGKIPVVVDPLLSCKLRPHQVQGVQFMFDCLTGLNGKKFKGKGCILADDMGLGKSFQAITILWTLLNQGPLGEPLAPKAIIVCPSSLVGNWCAELTKWLGDKVKPMPMGESHKLNPARLRKFQSPHEDYDVLVISYDQLKIHCTQVSKIREIGLLIADEGHRLKNAAIKTSIAINMIPTPRRIILSGTPIQNDLQEFYAMVSFVNPNILFSVTKFKNVFETPILQSREPDADREIREMGLARAIQLSEIVSPFILRRTSKTNLKYLPKKTEYTVFCRLTELQIRLYETLCKLLKPKKAFSRKERQQTNVEEIDDADRLQVLPLITILKKLCNSPDLITPKMNVPSSIFEELPEDFTMNSCHPQYSSKLQFLDRLMTKVCATTDERIVVVSNYTQTLTVIAKLCKMRNIYYFQLDGSTPVSKRQGFVDKFNLPKAKERIFLLSSKAGGVGLNLVGANHLILYDGDWNPANDAQAMARIWRPGQKRACIIYRLLSTGTIEEKIFQRQVTKMALSNSIVEKNIEDKPHFSTAELRNLFTLRTDTISDTHDLLGCRCSVKSKGIPVHKRSGNIVVGELAKWKHFDEVSKCEDELLAHASSTFVSFIFSNTIEPPPAVDSSKEVEIVAEENTPDVFLGSGKTDSSNAIEDILDE